MCIRDRISVLTGTGAEAAGIQRAGTVRLLVLGGLGVSRIEIAVLQCRRLNASPQPQHPSPLAHSLPDAPAPGLPAATMMSELSATVQRQRLSVRL
eukprot:1676834-Rhodomonas_salina.1